MMDGEGIVGVFVLATRWPVFGCCVNHVLTRNKTVDITLEFLNVEIDTTSTQYSEKESPYWKRVFKQVASVSGTLVLKDP